MIKYADLLKVMGQGTNVKIGYTYRGGFFYTGPLSDAPQIPGDTVIDNMYVFTGEDFLTIILN